MIFNFVVLLAVTFLAGLSSFFIPGVKKENYRLLLVFAGSYLFAITIIHILPELYAHEGNPTRIGILVLLGFFLQQFLDYFSKGIEHGHLHASGHLKRGWAPIMLLIALCIHSLLEGGLLAHPGALHQQHDANGLLLGILLHKAPAAFALMSILRNYDQRRGRALAYLLIFSLASPLGLLFSDFYLSSGSLDEGLIISLFALVSGNFLHISTTIVFESSVDHSFNARKLGVSLSGAAIAILAELVF